MVVGEPGIGKTAIIEQLATYGTVRGGKAVVGHSYEEGSFSLPYLAVVEALRTYILARPAEALREELGDGAADIARIISEVRDLVGVELQPPGDPEEDRWRLLQAVTNFLRAASINQPLVLILEDLHWADRGTLDLLTHPARNLAGARLLVVGTYRDVEVDRAHPLASALAELRRTANFGRVLLRGLTADEVQRMLSALATQDVPWGLAEAVHRQTEGNPLFIQEVLRYLVEEGMLTQTVGAHGARPAPASLDIAIPEGLREVIGRRLSRLSPECNRLLSIAAVIGRDFALETLQAVAAPPSAGGDVGTSRNLSPQADEAILAGLEEAVRVGVLETQNRQGSVAFRFAHAFFRQTLYEEMFTPHRLRMHQQVARALEAQYSPLPLGEGQGEGRTSRLQEHAGELAEHFAQSSDPADLTKAVAYGELAAKRAMAVFAYGEAVRVLEQALQGQDVVDPDDKAKRCDLLLALCEALGPAGEPRRVYEDVAEEAFGLAEGLGDHAGASKACQAALVGLRRYAGGTGAGTPEWARWAERAGQKAAPETMERLWADWALGIMAGAPPRFQVQESWALADRNLALARRLGQSDALFLAAFTILGNGLGPKREEERMHLAAEALQWPATGVNQRILSGDLLFASLALLGWGERAQAEAAWERLAALAERTKDPGTELLSLAADATVLFVAGDLEAAVGAGERLQERGEAFGVGPSGRLAARLVMARPLLELGRADEVLDLQQEAGIFTRPNRPTALAYLGRREEARAVLHEILGRWEDDGAGGYAAPTEAMVWALEAGVLLEERGLVERLVRQLDGLAGRVGSHFGSNRTCIGRHLGAGAVLLGDREQARRYYDQALAVAQKIRFRPEIALTRLGMAELLLAEAEETPPHPSPLPRGERGSVPSPSTGEGEGGGAPSRSATDLRREASEHLDFAIAEFREMKMQPSLERALRHKGLLKA